MTTRLVFFLVLILNSLAVIAAITIYSYTGVNHFKEGGFITVLSFLQLLVICRIVFQIKRHSLWKNPSAVWTIIALGFLFLAADELFKIHENIDFLIHYVFNMQETGLTDRIDDILIGLYGLTGIGVLFAYRNELKTYREALPFFICGFVLLFTMVALDVLTNRNDILPLIFDRHQAATLHAFLSLTEDSLKIFAESFFILVFYVILQTTKSRGKEAVLPTVG